MQSIEIYTDGACSKNPGPGGWAFVMLLKEDGEYQSGSELERGAGGEKETTNNRMELQAVIRALQQYAHNRAIDPEFPQTVSIHTDSQYVQQGISSWIKNWKKNGWKTSGKEPVKNKDLWLALDTLAEQYKPQWVWVKGHAGNFYNELCDTLAVAEVKKL